MGLVKAREGSLPPILEDLGLLTCGKKRCRLHGEKATGAPKGNKNALKHGRYTHEAIEERHQFGTLLREAQRTLTELKKRC